MGGAVMTGWNLAQLIRHVREEGGLSQAELARLVREEHPESLCHEQLISRWETGHGLKRKALYFSALEAAGAKIAIKKQGGFLWLIVSRRATTDDAV